MPEVMKWENVNYVVIPTEGESITEIDYWKGDYQKGRGPEHERWVGFRRLNLELDNAFPVMLLFPLSSGICTLDEKHTLTCRREKVSS
jgi:hypothetical protein